MLPPYVLKLNLNKCWENVPITLETATPTFGLELPTLLIWNLHHNPPPPPPPPLHMMSFSGSVKKRRRSLPDPNNLEFNMYHISTVVTSKGNVNATFEIPGKITIPSDNEQHNVTIAELDLEATMSWVCVPKGDTRVHLKVNFPLSGSSDNILLTFLGRYHKLLLLYFPSWKKQCLCGSKLHFAVRRS